MRQLKLVAQYLSFAKCSSSSLSSAEGCHSKTEGVSHKAHKYPGKAALRPLILSAATYSQLFAQDTIVTEEADAHHS